MFATSPHCGAPFSEHPRYPIDRPYAITLDTAATIDSAAMQDDAFGTTVLQRLRCPVTTSSRPADERTRVTARNNALFDSWKRWCSDVSADSLPDQAVRGLSAVADRRLSCGPVLPPPCCNMTATNVPTLRCAQEAAPHMCSPLRPSADEAQRLSKNYVASAAILREAIFVPVFSCRVGGRLLAIVNFVSFSAFTIRISHWPVSTTTLVVWTDQPNTLLASQSITQSGPKRRAFSHALRAKRVSWLSANLRFAASNSPKSIIVGEANSSSPWSRSISDEEDLERDARSFTINSSVCSFLSSTRGLLATSASNPSGPAPRPQPRGPGRVARFQFP